MFGSGLIKGLAVTAKHAFQREITEQWPEQRPDLPPASQGFFEYELEKCIGCGLCERACPNHVITLGTEKNEEGKKVVTSYVMEVQYCLFCGMCIEACPTKALRNANNFEIACYHNASNKIEFLSDIPHQMNEAFDKVQKDYWDKKRPEGNPIGMPQPVLPPRPTPAAKPAAKPGADAQAKPAAPQAAAKPAVDAQKQADTPKAQATEEGKGATE